MGVTPEIILGPPGTGKTTTLLRIVEQELESGVAPDRIGYVSFTKKAAGEAVSRACEKFGLDRRDLRFFRTLHSMCFQSLGLTNGDVLDGDKLLEFGDWLGMEVSRHRSMEEGTSFGFTPADRALFMENMARVKKEPLRRQYDMFCDDLPWTVVERVALGLAEFKRGRHLLDYTDMLSRFVAMEWTPRLEVLLVDEAQDLSLLQWDVVWKMARTCRRVVIAGDDDQAIYKWAGAAVEYFVSLEGRVRVLDQSWRVAREVQGIADSVIQRVRDRRPKQWAPRDQAGQVERLNSFDEVDVWGSEILVLVRNAYVAREILPLLRSDGVIYEWRGHPSIRQSTLDAVRTWESLRRGERAAVEDIRRVYAYMSAGVGVQKGHKTLPGWSAADELTMSELRERGGLMTDAIWHEAMDRMSPDEGTYLLRALQKGESTTKRPRVRVSTIHAAKGGEADHVVLMREMARRTWDEMYTDPESEDRVWYVAATRARSTLSVVSGRSKRQFDI